MRVRIVLHEKGIPFETKEEDLKNFSQEVQKLHPEAKVPVLIHGQQVLYESAIITEYIEDLVAEPRLMPLEPEKKAEIRLLTYWCNHVFKHHIDAYKYGEHRSSKEDVDAAPDRLNEDLIRLEKRLQDQPFLIGSDFSLGDVHVFPFFRQLYRTNPPLPGIDSYKQLEDWYNKINERPSFQKAMEKKKK